MTIVLDASAVLALVNAETGADRVQAALGDAIISAVNFAEVGSRLVDLGDSPERIDEQLRLIGFTVVAFDGNAAAGAVRLRQGTRHAGLSLADRACLALAIQRDAVALTADRAWATLDIGCAIELIR